jgi:hypothetical protein
MPAYELYLDQLRKGFFNGTELCESGKKREQLHVVLDKSRHVINIQNV